MINYEVDQAVDFGWIEFKSAAPDANICKAENKLHTPNGMVFRGSSYSCCLKLNWKIDLRLLNDPLRGSEKWQKRCNERTSAERLNNLLKTFFHCE